VTTVPISSQHLYSISRPEPASHCNCGKSPAVAHDREGHTDPGTHNARNFDAPGEISPDQPGEGSNEWALEPKSLAEHSGAIDLASPLLRHADGLTSFRSAEPMEIRHDGAWDADSLVETRLAPARVQA